MALEVTEHIAMITPGLRVVGFEFDGSVVAGEGLRIALEVVERIASIAPGLRVVGLEFDGSVVDGEGLLVPF